MKKKIMTYYQWLLTLDSNSGYGKLVAYFYKDKDFPRLVKEYDLIRDYLDVINTPHTIGDLFEESWDDYENYKGMILDHKHEIGATIHGEN